MDLINSILVKLKSFKSKYPYLFKLYVFFRKLLYSLQATILTIWFKAFPAKFSPDINSKIIVSLTSFPERINKVWITLESLKRQDLVPNKIILVLSEEEFPNKILPDSINEQVKYGIEILWTKENMRSYKKLIPTRRAYPDMTIVTFDDDMIYESWRLKKLVNISQLKPKAIIGHRGWVITKIKDKLDLYSNWQKADVDTNPYLCMLTGVGGILYPAHVLNENLLLDYDLANRLCPTADDIWFWAVANQSNVPCYCLGSLCGLEIVKSSNDTALVKINVLGGQNDVQLKSVLSHFEIKLTDLGVNSIENL